MVKSAPPSRWLKLRLANTSRLNGIRIGGSSYVRDMQEVKTPSREWIIERLADYKACRSHREVTAIESMFGQWLATPAPSDAAGLDLLVEVGASAVEFEDERVGYVAVQIDRGTWLELQRHLTRVCPPLPRMELVEWEGMKFDAFCTQCNQQVRVPHYCGEKSGDDSRTA